MQVAVQKPFEAHLPEARERLMRLLRHTAIRASKNDLETMARRTHKAYSSSPCPPYLISSPSPWRTCIAEQCFLEPYGMFP